MPRRAPPDPDPDAGPDTGPDTGRCWLCDRALGRRVERHHPVPRSRGGRTTRPVHPICHRALHAGLDNKTLAAIGDDAEALRAHPALAAFLGWIATKPPDFHAPTRRPAGRRR
ncbi:HNH endonuclease [Sphingomicrobium astaxanthinifaciens]|uniref:HNH endonuclease n=1 Tax=Sphingomicrobium astaxanthinifaciens TaxID=1227949 RepID=UPI001FCBDDF7|nr:HNH endonuclease [Sphingomicrobium astaxanthinifaciens]MCJ7421477.1 HNH endonuclease [Sphingomicrobium astaxanthinifaciens]